MDDGIDLPEAARLALGECLEQEARFVMEYVATGRKVEAMRQAGYSENYSQHAGILLARPRVQAAVRAVRAAVHRDVADLAEIQSHLSDIVRNDTVSSRDRTGAAAALLKSMGAGGPDVDARTQTVNVNVGGASFEQLDLVDFLHRLSEAGLPTWSEEAQSLLAPILSEGTH